MGRRAQHAKHGTRVYRIWTAMKARCSNPNRHNYKYYGARGISVCERWESFSGFFEDMGDPPTDKHTIDRIDNDGNYEPGNCAWATTREENQHKSDNRLLTLNGRTQHMTAWAGELGITPQALFRRIKVSKWPLEKALTKRNQKHGRT